VPDRILRAMSLPTIDHRGPEFAHLGLRVLKGMRNIFQTKHPVVIYPASGTGAWEAALVNTLSPGDHVLMYETGQFAALWDKLATRLGLKTEVITLPGGRRLAQGRAVALDRGAPARRHATRDQGRLRGPQRNLHGRDQRYRRREKRDQCGEASGLAAR
jgi:hypothetical protein